MPLFRSYLVNRTKGSNKHYYIGVLRMQVNGLASHYQIRVAWGKVGQIQAEKLYPTRYNSETSATNAAYRLRREKESKGYQEPGNTWQPNLVNPRPSWWNETNEPVAVAQPAQQGRPRQQAGIYDNIDRTTAPASPSITTPTTTAVNKVCGNCGKKTTDYVNYGTTQYCRPCFTKVTGTTKKTEPEEEEDAAVKRFKLLELD